MKGGGIEIGERLKCPKCGTRLVASRGPESGRTGAASESQGGAWVLHDASAPPPAPVASDPDDEPLEYSLRVEPWQRPGAVVDPPVGGDPSAHVGGETEKAEYPSPVLPNGIRRPPTPVKRDGRVRRKRPGEEEEPREDEEPAEEAVLVWQPGRGVSLWRLFFAGTFTFPFRPGVLIYVVFLLTMHLLSVLQLGIGVSSPFYVGFVGGAFLAACAWGMLASCYGLTILRDTSYGADNVEWPSLLTLDALGDLGYVVTSLFFAVLPGWGVATLGQSPSEETLVVMVVSAIAVSGVPVVDPGNQFADPAILLARLAERGARAERMDLVLPAVVRPGLCGRALGDRALVRGDRRFRRFERYSCGSWSGRRPGRRLDGLFPTAGAFGLVLREPAATRAGRVESRRFRPRPPAARN